MKHYIFSALFLISGAFCVNAQNSTYLLSDFYADDPELDRKTEQVFSALSDTQRVGQMIVPPAGELGRPEAVLLRLVAEGKVGSINYLRGTREAHRELIRKVNETAAKYGQLPVLHGMDAEPGLLKGRIKGSGPVPAAAAIKSPEANEAVARAINKELLELGILHNYAPVSDLGTANAAIKSRSYGSSIDSVILFNRGFIAATQDAGIVATAKHFPGHGLVTGDTHKQSVYIDGELKELGVYPPLIEQGLISVLVGHMTIINNDKYNTNGLPASLSRNIVTGLLREELGFKGLIVTDALNAMKAVTIIENSALKASMAGCDLLCMPLDENQAIASILDEMGRNEAYKNQVYTSVKKIIRLKIVLGLIKM
ncbi:MAG: glycoside hydrolase family 3 N-terminal domain-containing protein [Flavobacteriales bacterium]